MKEVAADILQSCILPLGQIRLRTQILPLIFSPEGHFRLGGLDQKYLDTHPICLFLELPSNLLRIHKYLSLFLYGTNVVASLSLEESVPGTPPNSQISCQIIPLKKITCADQRELTCTIANQCLCLLSTQVPK